MTKKGQALSQLVLLILLISGLVGTIGYMTSVTVKPIEVTNESLNISGNKTSPKVIPSTGKSTESFNTSKNETSPGILISTGKAIEPLEYQKTCSDECIYIGEKECLNSSFLGICGNYDKDECLEWNVVYCEYGCSLSECKSPPTCIEGYLYEYDCSGNWRQQKYRYRNCTIIWKNVEYCDYGCVKGVCKSIECKGTFRGIVSKIIDGDTLEIKGCYKSIRLALVDAPEYYKSGYKKAKSFTESLCEVGSEAIIDQDDGQPYDVYGRIVALVYCKGKKLNAELIYNGLGVIDTRFCKKSEFAKEDWAWNYGCEEALQPPQQINCDPSYPDVCIPPPPPDLDCKDIPYRNFRVLPPDPHRFDRDKDGIGCET